MKLSIPVTRFDNKSYHLGSVCLGCEMRNKFSWVVRCGTSSRGL
jgi:hypothetical protein